MKSLKAQGHKLATPEIQLEIINQPLDASIPRFEDRLSEMGMNPLRPAELEIFQMNVGYMCNLTCSHCHVDAGPDRKEIMTRETMLETLKALDASKAHTVDLTGGAPEMNPDFRWFVEELSKRGKKIIVRSNLTILVANNSYRELPEFFKKHNVTVIASMPCYTADNVDRQRGDGVFDDSIEAIQMLNAVGYGKEGSGLELDFVYNPGGASLPPAQEALKEDYKRELKKHFDIEFNELYTITNMPISRFLDSLLIKERYQSYMDLLANSFNPETVFGLMCRNTLSIGWDGRLFDCDFNQILDMELEANGISHIKYFNEEKLADRDIRLAQHCFGCTAGAGSSCQGSII